jgi:peptide/nickel transport system permease protein
MLTLNYIVRRAALSVTLVLGVLLLSFVLTYYAPGDPALTWAGRPRGPGALEAIERARRELGLDRPLWYQLSTYLQRFLNGDWGTSVKFKAPVLGLVLRGFAASLELVAYSFLIAVPVGYVLGISAALSRGGLRDRAIYYFSAAISGTPRFVTAAATYIALYVLSQVLGTPVVYGRVASGLRVGFTEVTGAITIDSVIQGRLDVLVDSLVRIIPPALVLSTYPMGVLARVVRLAVAETLEEEYVRQAVSLGIPAGVVLRRYVAPSVMPVVTQLSGLFFSYSLVEAMAVEGVFGREGLGYLLVKALESSDYPLIVGSIVLVSIVFVIANTVADVVQAKVNPRVVV